MGDYTYKWISKAPIEVHSGDRADHRGIFDLTAKMLAGDINDYSEDLTDAHTSANKDPAVKRAVNQTLDTLHGKVSHAHQSGNIDGAKSMAIKFDKGDTLKPGRVGFTYMFAGRPLAMMVLMTGRGWVCDLLCHPGAKGAGGIMIEFAVNYRLHVEDCIPPKLGLYPLTPEARSAYENMGFVDDGKSGLVLDLKKPGDKWRMAGDGWRYVSSATPEAAGYLASIANHAGVPGFRYKV